MSSGCYFSVQHMEAIHYLSDRVPTWMKHLTTCLGLFTAMFTFDWHAVPRPCVCCGEARGLRQRLSVRGRIVAWWLCFTRGCLANNWLTGVFPLAVSFAVAMCVVTSHGFSQLNSFILLRDVANISISLHHFNFIADVQFNFACL